MSNKSFVHLHVHTQYSLLESTCVIEKIINKCVEYNMPAVAITDNGNMFGALEFYFAAKKKNIKPIIGMEVYLAPNDNRWDKSNFHEPYRRLVLLACGYQGYQNLCQISTKAYLEGFYYKPRVDYQLLSEFNENIIVLSGGHLGEISWLYQQRGKDIAFGQLEKLKNIFSDRLYVEITRTIPKQQENTNDFLLKSAKDLQLPIVATNDVYYLESEDQIAQEVLVCIGTNRTLSDDTRFRLGSDQFYLKSVEEMYSLFDDIPQVCENTLEIFERCNIEFKTHDENNKSIYHLPSFPTKNGRSLKEEIKKMAYEGLEYKFQGKQIQFNIDNIIEDSSEIKEPNSKNSEIKENIKTNKTDNINDISIGNNVKNTNDEESKTKNIYFSRLSYELSVINKMGFDGYFLIVQDFINWAKNNDVPVGPGRGSGAGSLVAFVLGITDIDPIPNNLIFERFLNPERISMPDFDIDFCQEKRQKVIDYVTNKYGQDSVAQIITYGKLMAKVAIRDVGRVLGMTYGEVDVIAKLVPNELNITIKRAIEIERRLRDLMESDPRVANLLYLAQKIEGLVRHVGIHAAGVIIGDKPLVNYAPLYKGAQGEIVVQYDMKHAEKIGLIKFDFLGLKTLTHLNHAFKLIEDNHNKKIKFTDISMSDPGIYEILMKGSTAGIFQFESEGITDTVMKIKPTCFADIVAINALYRPGPMDMIFEYTMRKHGKSKIVYLFPELEDILKETYGIIVYQEQVQLIAAKIADYSLGEADVLRRAMGKKNASEMEKQRNRFLEGAKKNGQDLKKSQDLFDLMYKFAEYGFNKSHAAAYCVIAAQTAWVKYYYPVEFYAALLSTELNSTDKIVKYVKDICSRGIEIKGPHINHSDFKFTVRGKVIYFGLGAVKGVGTSAVENILEARKKCSNHKFSSLEEFFSLADLRKINKKVIECLIKCGALDDFGYHRAMLYNGYSKFLNRAEQIQKEKEIGQISLFSLSSDDKENKVQLEPLENWSRKVKLLYEKETLGFYLSGHPLLGIENLLKNIVFGNIEEVIRFFKGQREENNNKILLKKKIKLLGMISNLKEYITKKGTRMAFGRLEDLSGFLEIIIPPDVYFEYEMSIKREDPLIVEGEIEFKEHNCRLVINKVILVKDIILQAKRLSLKINPYDKNDVIQLKKILNKFKGDTEVFLSFKIDDLNKNIELKMKEKVNLDEDLFENLYSSLGQNDIADLIWY